ncbi:MAG: hypothetical protein NZ874_07330 [Fimbriimonadales bacterium]|nr:hypothetical protein [Fimbriimonadales bacterium]
MLEYRRTPNQLREHASLYWPKELLQGCRADTPLVISRLLETQEIFLSVLGIADREYDSWRRILQETSLPANLFLKHLMILADVGGEIFKRLTPLPEASEIAFSWRGRDYAYPTKVIHIRQVSNSSLKTTKKQVLNPASLTPEIEDAIMFLLFAGLASNFTLPSDIQNRCTIGLLLGNRYEIERFIKQRYILVSPILKGASANELGHEAQRFVREFLQQRLGEGSDFSQQRIPDVSQTHDGREITFDIVAVSPEGRYCAIEVSFQVTTNSVIERKAGQAQSRYEKLHEKGHRIAYVVDGAGNFERKQALTTICQYSDCTVAFSPSELEVLAKFLVEQGGR